MLEGPTSLEAELVQGPRALVMLPVVVVVVEVEVTVAVEVK